MTLRDKIILTLWVERSSSIARLSNLTGRPRQAVYSATYALCREGLIEHPLLATYRLNALGLHRAEWLLNVRSASLFGEVLLFSTEPKGVFHA